MSRLRLLSALAASAVLVTVALTACTAAAPARTPAPTAPVSTADWPTARLFHVGRSTVELEMPTGARSLHVDFSCTAGLYAVAPALGGMDTRSGTCGGAQSFDFDLGHTYPGTRVRVDLTVPDDARFAAALSFSPRAFVPDQATKKQCAELSAITEAFWNADQAHDHGDLTDAGWAQKTGDAKARLAALSEAAQREGAAAGLLGPVIPQLAAWLTGDGDRPGGLEHAPLGDFTAADSLAGQICESNGTPIAVNSAYGG